MSQQKMPKIPKTNKTKIQPKANKSLNKNLQQKSPQIIKEHVDKEVETMLNDESNLRPILLNSSTSDKIVEDTGNSLKRKISDVVERDNLPKRLKNADEIIIEPLKASDSNSNAEVSKENYNKKNEEIVDVTTGYSNGELVNDKTLTENEKILDNEINILNIEVSNGKSCNENEEVIDNVISIPTIEVPEDKRNRENEDIEDDVISLFGEDVDYEMENSFFSHQSKSKGKANFSIANWKTKETQLQPAQNEEINKFNSRTINIGKIQKICIPNQSQPNGFNPINKNTKKIQSNENNPKPNEKIQTIVYNKINKPIKQCQNINEKTSLPNLSRDPRLQPRNVIKPPRNRISIKPSLVMPPKFNETPPPLTPPPPATPQKPQTILKKTIVKNVNNKIILPIIEKKVMAPITAPTTAPIKNVPQTSNSVERQPSITSNSELNRSTQSNRIIVAPNPVPNQSIKQRLPSFAKNAIIIKSFSDVFWGICHPFLDNNCHNTQCKYAHKIPDPIEIRKILDKMDPLNVNEFYDEFMRRIPNLFDKYLEIICDYYATRGNLDKIKQMAMDCYERKKEYHYPKLLNGLIKLQPHKSYTKSLNILFEWVSCKRKTSLKYFMEMIMDIRNRSQVFRFYKIFDKFAAECEDIFKIEWLNIIIADQVARSDMNIESNLMNIIFKKHDQLDSEIMDKFLKGSFKK